MDRAMKSTAINQERQTGPNEGRLWSDESDRLLLDRITKGDRDAFRALYEVYYPPLRRFISKIAGLNDAQEGVNDVMLVVWRNGASFTGRSKVRTWIMGIAYRKALKLRATSSRWTGRFKGVDFDSWIEQSGVPSEPPSDGDLRDLLQHGLDRLSPEHRAVVELTYFNGCSYEEIAAIAGCPINTVKTRMFHARAKLRRLLPALGVERPDA
jgi:RNA polymerase sigma-70 factor, ECF subfamily